MQGKLATLDGYCVHADRLKVDVDRDTANRDNAVLRYRFLATFILLEKISTYEIVVGTTKRLC